MKRSISILLCLVIVFSSFSFIFGAATDWSTTDQSNLSNASSKLTNIYSWLTTYAPTFNQISTTNSSLSTMVNTLNTISSRLIYGNYSLSGIALSSWEELTVINANLATIKGWLDPSNGSSTSAVLNQILNAITHTDLGGNIVSWFSDLYSLQSNNLPNLTNFYNSYLTGWDDGIVSGNNITSFWIMNQDGTLTNYSMSGNRNFFDTFVRIFRTFNNSSTFANSNILSSITSGFTNVASILSTGFNNISSGYNVTQRPLSWTSLTAQSFTPTSDINGLYSWLSYIQSPVARLSYVLASDEEIAARNAAAANQDAVVDNFIDSNGSGSASPSDISSVSDLSGDFKDNISTDANPSDFWTIFDSTHYSWFSQETADQLDTTTNNRKSNYNFDTPLLDENINEIYNILGVKYD